MLGPLLCCPFLLAVVSFVAACVADKLGHPDAAEVLWVASQWLVMPLAVFMGIVFFIGLPIAAIAGILAALLSLFRKDSRDVA